MIYVMNEEGGIIAMLPEQRLIRSFSLIIMHLVHLTEIYHSGVIWKK